MKKAIISFLIFCAYLSIHNLEAREEFVVYNEHPFTPTFTNRFTLGLGLNPNLQKSGDVSHFALNYESFQRDHLWLDINFIMTSGLFEKLTTNNSRATTLTEEDLSGTKSKHMGLGVGIAYESRYAQTLLPFNDIYELTAANLTYNLFQEPTSNKSFSGPGLLAKYSVFKKFSDYFSIGTQFTYNLSVVKRSQEFDTESSSARSLTLSYLTLGFDLSFYL
jgi:hypothetical protein